MEKYPMSRREFIKSSFFSAISVYSAISGFEGQEFNQVPIQDSKPVKEFQFRRQGPSDSMMDFLYNSLPNKDNVDSVVKNITGDYIKSVEEDRKQ